MGRKRRRRTRRSRRRNESRRTRLERRVGYFSLTFDGLMPSICAHA